MKNFPPIENNVLETLFEERPKLNRLGRKTRGKYSVEYIEINGVRFYYMSQFINQDAAYLAVTEQHPGVEWVIWPRGGWGNPTLPAVYVRDLEREKELAAEAKKAALARSG